MWIFKNKKKLKFNILIYPFENECRLRKKIVYKRMSLSIYNVIVTFSFEFYHSDNTINTASKLLICLEWKIK
jgi:hypothetical protein